MKRNGFLKEIEEDANTGYEAHLRHKQVQETCIWECECNKTSQKGISGVLVSYSILSNKNQFIKLSSLNVMYHYFLLHCMSGWSFFNLLGTSVFTKSLQQSH